jgi:hypothetical protein
MLPQPAALHPTSQGTAPPRAGGPPSRRRPDLQASLRSKEQLSYSLMPPGLPANIAPIAHRNPTAMPPPKLLAIADQLGSTPLTQHRQKEETSGQRHPHPRTLRILRHKSRRLGSHTERLCFGKSSASPAQSTVARGAVLITPTPLIQGHSLVALLGLFSPLTNKSMAKLFHTLRIW